MAEDITMSKKMTTADQRKSVHIDSKTLSTTITLISISLISVLLTIPSNVFLLVVYSGVLVKHFKDPVFMVHFALIYSVSQMLILLNSVVNFYIYFVTGLKFRDELKQMFHCKSSEIKKHYFTKSTKMEN